MVLDSPHENFRAKKKSELFGVNIIFFGIMNWKALFLMTVSSEYQSNCLLRYVLNGFINNLSETGAGTQHEGKDVLCATSCHVR